MTSMLANWYHGRGVLDFCVIVAAAVGRVSATAWGVSRFRDWRSVARHCVLLSAVLALVGCMRSDLGKKQLIDLAIQKANAKRIEILPFPDVGRPYAFALTTTDGKTVDSSKLKGKVILIDVWASWCGPCKKMVPELKEIYSQWHDKGLEVVGVSLDDDVEAAERAQKSHDIPWPLFVVPADEENRKLWTEANRIESLPRLLLIDQRGVLHADSASPQWNLKEAIGALLIKK